VFGKPVQQISPEELDRFLALRLDEGQRLEYKQTLVDGLKLARSIAAMANADGGVIIIGVGTKGIKPVSFAGIPSTPNVEDTILNLVSAHLRPRPRVEVRQLPKVGVADTSYLVIRVPWTENTPCEVIRWSDGEPLIPIRMGSDTRRASVSEITSLMARRLSPTQESDLVERVLLTFPLLEFNASDSHTRLPAFHFRLVPLTERFAIEMTSETDFEIAEAARFFGPFVSVPDDASVRERLFGIRTEPRLVGATYGQGSIEFARTDASRERMVATTIRITSSGGLYVAGLLGTDVVLFRRVLAYALGSVKFAKWLLGRGFHHGRVFLRVDLTNVDRRSLDFGVGRPASIQLDRGCTIERTKDYDELADPALLTTEIARRALREFQLAVPDQRIEELVSSLEELEELT
jgi:hypothetical protein